MIQQHCSSCERVVAIALLLCKGRAPDIRRAPCTAVGCMRDEKLSAAPVGCTSVSTSDYREVLTHSPQHRRLHKILDTINYPGRSL